MGVKLQLLLGLILFGSICGLEENTTHSQNVSLEKVDSTINSIEKIPKTDARINLVNKDTQDFADSVKYSEYDSEKDTQRNQTSSEEKINKYDSSDSKEDDKRGRQSNSRSIDIEKFDTHDFQNNDYSSDNEKRLENTIRKPSTKNFIDYPIYPLTTPKSFFDAKFEEAKQKLEQEYEEHSDDHRTEDEIDHDHRIRIDELFDEAKNKPNSTLAYREKTKISKNNTISDGSEYNELKVETTHNINYDSILKFTTSDDDDSEKIETTSLKLKLETTSPRGFVATTRKSVHLTKSPISRNNHILSNKIESETIKAINLLTTEYSTTKRLKEENDVIPLEQTVEENKIIPLETVPFTTEHITKGRTGIPLDKTTEQIVTTINYAGFTDTTASSDNSSTTELFEQTTFVRVKEEQATYQETNEPVTNIETTIKTELTTAEQIIGQDDNQTTTDQIFTVSTTEATKTTHIPSIESTTEATKTTHIPTIESTTETTETTNNSSSESTTVLTTIQDLIEQTTIPDTTSTDEYTTQQITTESVSRISKAFSFQSTDTVTPETTKIITDTTSDVPETTEVTTEIIMKKYPIGDSTTTRDITVIDIGTDNETTTDAVTKTEIVTTTKHVVSKIFETTTHIPKLETTTVETTEKSNLSTLTMKENFTTSVTDSGSTILSYPEIKATPVIPIFRNGSSVSEDASISTSTESSSESSTGTDAGNLGGSEENKGKIAAIIISSVGAVCLILLAGLLYIMRKRQRRFNYKQRCRPVGLDDYSVDNVSGFNSTRRKAERQSKRSYGNPAFDDPVAVTHPLNFPALAKFATNKEDIKAEFEEIPQIIAKTYELPEGCETKNRYANVIPLPETRVFLQPIEGYPNSDYINANYVTGPKNTKGYYIACQGPMSNTVDDFWRMIWEQQTKVILMLTYFFEKGIEKCVDYLPPSEVLDCNRLFGDFQVTLKKRDVKDKYIISNLQLKNMVSNSWREVTHFWYMGWPEKGVPAEENSIIAFLIEARSYMKSATLDKNSSNGNLNGLAKNEINPVVVHCSPGTGRTGVVIACDIAIREFEQTRLVDIPKIVYRIRRDRASAVQTKEQYMFIYKVVSLYATKLTGGALESF
ncbi:unnamed protein product [Psylliodes chrysocephalus]|uniref:Uncharacterized protein n=1 Tax=Psylliodes chrysocephalus TaxID=3402493 RepID=A0A9P0CCW2_9CUCU|nr:unnamed protein product [Psylliodes chrysocephala]